eukprot:6726838-Alexandrium_andersonii.AAC.1
MFTSDPVIWFILELGLEELAVRALFGHRARISSSPSGMARPIGAECPAEELPRRRIWGDLKPLGSRLPSGPFVSGAR